MDANWIGNTFTSDVGWNHLETLVDIRNRMAGSTGEREAAEKTRRTLARFARDARLEEFEIQGWERVSSTITTSGDDAYDYGSDCIALPRSPDASAEGELTDLGYGLPSEIEDADVEGKIVMVSSDVPDYYDRFVHRREKYYAAAENGASGFIFRNHIDGCLAPTGSLGRVDATIGKIPGVGVSKEAGMRLSRRFDGEKIRVETRANIGDSTSQNVHAELGPSTDERVLLTSHVDAHDIAEGAADNGAGTAMVVEVGRALAEREDELDTRVELVCYGAEEVGLLGSKHHAANTDVSNIKAVVNNDGVVRDRTLELYTHKFESLGEVAHDVADYFDHPVKTKPRNNPHSDHWSFVERGVPGYHVKSRTGSRDRGWGHTKADTLDKLEPRNLREQAILIAELVVRIADEGFSVEHKTPDEVQQALEDEGYIDN
ncbi:MAG: M28 family metallopeptidase [Halobacteria archaeon]|nr:M28 family metallopeptidase [Halobacteria archaeon]